MVPVRTQVVKLPKGRRGDGPGKLVLFELQYDEIGQIANAGRKRPRQFVGVEINRLQLRELVQLGGDCPTQRIVVELNVLQGCGETECRWDLAPNGVVVERQARQPRQRQNLAGEEPLQIVGFEGDFRNGASRRSGIGFTCDTVPRANVVAGPPTVLGGPICATEGRVEHRQRVALDEARCVGTEDERVDLVDPLQCHGLRVVGSVESTGSGDCLVEDGLSKGGASVRQGHALTLSGNRLRAGGIVVGSGCIVVD